ncbi:hypothetical protein ACFQ8T_12585 [Isoptericola sp. NPDC056618]|uniref:hypothetical protein n=1 Tax=Isoptericola sp. NPDC056618 TaxID=3345878 RepID=UPI00369DC206
MNDQLRQVRTAADLLPFAELTSTTTYEVHGRRLPSDEARPEEDCASNFNVLVRKELGELETRARVQVLTTEADLLADIGATYSFSEPLHLEEDVVQEFVERAGVMAVFPYLREAIQTTATRLGVDAPVLGLLRAGSFRLSLNTDDEAVVAE